NVLRPAEAAATAEAAVAGRVRVHLRHLAYARQTIGIAVEARVGARAARLRAPPDARRRRRHRVVPVDVRVVVAARVVAILIGALPAPALLRAALEAVDP